MPSMTIKSIPDRIYNTLKLNAKLNHRSLNGEAVACFENSLGLSRTDTEDRLARIDTLRMSITPVKINDETLKSAKNAGRP
ncbi:MAG: DNA-binding protein [Kiritimatiellae bacterium]|nr:DNA-binding protein [Kiritimatiellia bacterium]